jgi:hypothetical protein
VWGVNGIFDLKIFEKRCCPETRTRLLCLRRMKENTTLQVDVQILPEFLRNLGTQCRFISMTTEVEVECRKTNNPFVGTVKRSRRNGLVNVKYVEGIIRRMRESGIEEPTYTPGKTWYVHEHDTQGNPIPLCQSKKDNSKKYLQYFPWRSYDNTYFHNGVQLTDKEIEILKTFIPPITTKPFKRSVITLSMDSIRRITFRNINTEVLNFDKLFR